MCRTDVCAACSVRAARVEEKNDLKRFSTLRLTEHGRVDGDRICVPDTNRSDANNKTSRKTETKTHSMRINNNYLFIDRKVGTPRRQ